MIRELVHRTVPRWSALGQMGESKILRSSYFWLFAVPLLAKALYSSEPHILHLPQGLRLHLELPFSWKVFYFSSVIFAVASLLYSIACPRVVRDYQRYSEWSEQGRGDRQIVRELFFLLFRPSVPAIQQEALVEHFAEITNSKVPRREEMVFPEGVVPAARVDLQRVFDMRIPDVGMLPTAFWYVRDYADEIRPLARLLCAAFFTLGFGLLGVVAVQNFAYVWRHAF